MWKLFWLLFVLCPQRFVEASLTLCDSPQSYLEVEEGKQNNTFTCSGLKQAETVQWFLEYPPPSNQPALIGTCFTNLSCSVQVKAIFDLSRTADTSVITVNETAIFNKQRLLYARHFCRNQRLTNHGVKSITYGSQESTRVVGFYSMDLGQSTANKYVSGSCNLTSFLPPNGRYSYSVVILPGKVKVPATFNGNNTIRQPPVSPTHNCPLFVKEGDTVNCKCSVDDYGSPPGKLKWNTGSDQLLLTGVKKEQHGMTYVCSVVWNNTVFQPVNYTLLIAYPPTQMSFKLNNASESVTVTEKSPVTMLCQSDGRPTPNMTITDVTNGNRVVHSQSRGNVTLADQSVQTRYDKVVECEDTGEYRCTADNIIGSKYQAVKLFVMCKPRTASTDDTSKPPTIFEGRSASFQLIAYPTPVNVTKYFLGSNLCSCETLVSDDVFRVDCSSSSQWIYKITCTVTVIKVTSYAAGLYKAVVSNELGGVPLIFEAMPQNITETEKSNDIISAEFSRGQKSGLGIGLGIGLGVAAAEALIFATLVLVFFWRRKKQTSNTRGGRKNTAYSSRQDILSDKTTELNSLRSTSGHDKNEQESAYEAIGSSETSHTAAYTNVEGSVLSRKTSNTPGDVYDGLRLHDVGVSSPYASLS